MTQKFTTPCFIRKSTAELRKKLEELGYKPSLSVNIKEPYLWTSENGIYYSSCNNLSQEYGEYIGPYGIFCKDDEDLFLALAALREDSEYMQWFTDGEFWDVNFRDDIPFCEQVGSNDFHKATVEELIEHFK